jgi:hypothetical protein
MNEKRDVDRVPVGEIKAGGTTWEVSFHSRTHQFWAKSPGFTDVSGRDWEAVDTQVRARVGKARVRVSVPYVVVWDLDEGGHLEPTLAEGTATGVHAGSGKVTATQGGKNRSLEITGYGRDGYMTPFTEGERERYLELLVRRRSLEEMIKACEDDHRWDGRGLRAKVEKEVERARVTMAGDAETAAEEPGHGHWEAGDL